MNAKDGIETTSVALERWLDEARALVDAGYTRFIDLTAFDEPERAPRFELHLVVYSMNEKRWRRITTRTDDKIASVVSIFLGAHNYEREVFDLFGVIFEGHPGLTRILLPDGWRGHPLRRDEPLVVEPVDFTITRSVYRT